MLTWSRILPTLVLVGTMTVLSACAPPSVAPAKPGNDSANAQSGTDADAGVAGPQAGDCPQGLRDLAIKLPEESFTGDEISVGQFLAGDDAKYVAVGLAPSCVFESTQNNTKHSVFYIGEGDELLASLAGTLTTAGLTPAPYNNDHSQNWSNEYRSVVVSIQKYGAGEDNEWSGVDFGDEFVWVWIAFVPE